ncbi:MAG: ACP-SH:acetate ligase [Desulfovibrio sp.]
MERLTELEMLIDDFGTAPTLAEMPRRSLADKGIAGPTAAHVIEEVHSPLNLAFVTFTTGSTAFQNIVGVTYQEIDARVAAAHKAFELAGVERGAHVLVTYAPLANVFPAKAFAEYGMTWKFLRRSSRDALILDLCRDKPNLLAGESSFLRATLVDAVSLGYEDLIPRGVTVFCAGTPLDLEFLPLAEKYGWKIHDLYGCQEFGWLTLNGVPLRDDISLAPSPIGENYREIVVGGLPLADSCPYSESGHVCDKNGKIITYRRVRTSPEYEVYVAATTFSNPTNLERAARTILRIKGRVVKIRPDIQCNADATVLQLVSGAPFLAGSAAPEIAMTITGPEKTKLFDIMVQAQVDLQNNAKTDPAWTKGR